jgi:hypothetical protein
VVSWHPNNGRERRAMPREPAAKRSPSSAGEQVVRADRHNGDRDQVLLIAQGFDFDAIVIGSGFGGSFAVLSAAEININ